MHNTIETLSKPLTERLTFEHQMIRPTILRETKK